MPTTSTCPESGTPLPADAPQGLCPKCLLRHGMEVTPTSSEPQPTPIHIVNPTPLTPPANIRYFGDAFTLYRTNLETFYGQQQ